jgi:O-acetyl-ADP-ribose deacetylase (regulator of RNase III)
VGLVLFDTKELRCIFNFPTKRHWRSKSKIEDIQSGLKDLRRLIVSMGIASIAIPALGCGLGELSWDEVQPLIEEELEGLEHVQIYLYGPLI